LTGLASEEEGKLLSQMESMRERADYDATFTASEPIITAEHTICKDSQREKAFTNVIIL